MPKSIVVNGTTISHHSLPQLICEVGVNHFGDVDEAINISKSCISAGASLIKFQHFSTSSLISRKSSPEWYDRISAKQLSNSALLEIASEVTRMGGTFFCTAHDDVSFDFLLENIDPPILKIGSGELKNWSFIQRHLDTQKPVIISTGMYLLDDIFKLDALIQRSGNSNVAILHCTTQYPSPLHSLNLSFLATLRRELDYLVGYSDHSDWELTPLLAVASGACILEKHVTRLTGIDNAQDWKCSLHVSKVSELLQNIHRCWTSLGQGARAKTSRSACEETSRIWAQKSIHFNSDLPAGHILGINDLCFKRPGTGLSPDMSSTLIGKQLIFNVNKDDLVIPGTNVL